MAGGDVGVPATTRVGAGAAGAAGLTVGEMTRTRRAAHVTVVARAAPSGDDDRAGEKLGLNGFPFDTEKLASSQPAGSGDGGGGGGGWNTGTNRRTVGPGRRCSPRQLTHSELSFLELHGIL